MDQYVAKAVKGMQAQLESQLPTEITALETELGLSAGAIVPPVDYVRHRAPQDNRSPLIQVFDTGPFSEIQQQDGIWLVAVMIRFSYVGDANVEANEDRVRDYVTAIMRAVLDDTTLGGEASGANFVGGEPFVLVGDESSTRYVWEFTWEAFICSVEP